MVFLRRNSRWTAALGKSESAEKKAPLPIGNTAKSRTVIPRRGIVREAPTKANTYQRAARCPLRTVSNCDWNRLFVPFYILVRSNSECLGTGLSSLGTIAVLNCLSSGENLSYRTSKTEESIWLGCELLLESFDERRLPELERRSLTLLKRIAPHCFCFCRIT
jgi:hypothetical protein